ncbi:hypothetical protein III56_001918 [Salmonella enterica subsp. enterica serovar Bovismorbificans]|jgi:hypothetical protein|uniref:Bbp19 family protein n=1 Tax=Citrobacter sp. Cb005 TaxID=2985007 RepID=UPI0012C8E770|nr:hypothetical protein [Citrobacter sp. Cb005]ECA2524351.1 hypothetical protein [Salmonella enterica subsp. enterica serovar Bovismorbificans]EDV7054219.1 hypothetical protein [Salmonella enterica subsp. enterica]EGM9180015.1 hypothetical protein [Salmonella enterica subsp. enterica serovar Bovismorbificans]EGM9554483.1 hypothetical protein [Salmonella enterica subsp. enterica serovar Bovismorbificans]EGN0144539.1 hypothetical protein [Salmonella enterica subsp. enterica serovar Bovismorbific
MNDFDDEGRKAELDAKQQLLAQRDIDDIQFVMGSEQGRRVIWSLLEKGQVFGACFNVDPQITAFNEGQRNLALVLFQRVMAHCPDQYLKMAAEAGEDNL